jgi:hypothetical protein
LDEPETIVGRARPVCMAQTFKAVIQLNDISRERASCSRKPRSTEQQV